MNFFATRSYVTQISIWLIVIAVFGIVGIKLMFDDLIEQQLLAQAKTVVNNVQSLGQQTATHGRFWVKAGPDYPTNRFLDKVQISETEFFYSKNPALVQREFSESVRKNSFPASFRMTSRRPMNINNMPEDFELLALMAMEEAHKEGKRIEPQISHKDGVFQYVEPVFHEKSCIACHGDAKDAPAAVLKNFGDKNGFGFKEGDLAGGIAVKINYQGAVVNLVTYKVVLLLLIPALLFLAYIYLSSKKIGIVATRMANYTRGTSIGVNVNEIDEKTHNELDRLVLGFSKMASHVEGANLQVDAMQEERLADEKKIAQLQAALRVERQKNKQA